MPLMSILLLTGKAFGQVEEKEPAAIVEIGGAGQWALNHGKPSYGPNFAVEVTPIKEWPLKSKQVSPPSLAMVKTEWDTRPSLQEAVHAIQNGGVHARSWSGMGAHH